MARTSMTSAAGVRSAVTYLVSSKRVSCVTGSPALAEVGAWRSMAASPLIRWASSGSTSAGPGAAARAALVRPGEIHGRPGMRRPGLMSVLYAAVASGLPAASGTTAISGMASSSRSWAPLPSRSRATRGAVVQSSVLPVMALGSVEGWVSAVCISRLGDQLLAQCGDVLGLGAGRGPAGLSPGPARPGLLGAGAGLAGRLDVLVDVEDVAGVVAVLDPGQAVVVAAVGGLDPVLALAHQEVDVAAARRGRVQRFPVVPQDQVAAHGGGQLLDRGGNG